MFVTLTDFSPDEVPYLTLTDGSTLTLNDLGYATPTPLTEELDQCRLQFIFNEVLPLDTVASITIGDLTIPLPRRLSPEPHTRPKAAFGLGARRLQPSWLRRAKSRKSRAAGARNNPSQVVRNTSHR